ncbi:HAMP domain-containing sensor histidine kinase [Pseudomonas sp. DTU_2021_1001937_2_SI_NGA_ILE_001]|uniref:sensor histidine kinase n=1 Tax=Pseudomonas sp. DTU_2021_1001937_2_SI_NGA_ILE_001 TaxID=3077589 RepID=UPI0028FC3223|nr:HAMP domain-containing sensor histidine kinase [Pseudomonas sp. DTU_2021_1001937_2_SI_NGA_ILE_001]WNW13965.1 HAMP domain-containing sensor histidine kinase [Pseudomonas sp. DTU_2021_1001937_2_SI_NGA_ILE_001]
MRSLFWRILASFWLAIALVAGLSILVGHMLNQDAWILSRHPVLNELPKRWATHFEEEGPGAAQDFLEKLKRRHRIDVQVLNSSGEPVIPGTFPPRAAAFEARQKDDPQQLPWRRLTTEYTSPNSGETYLLIYRIPHPELDQWHRQSLVWPISALLIALVVLTLFSLLVTLSITRPLSRLRSAVYDLGQTSYQQHSLAQLANRRDEFGVLATDFNRMGARLQSLIASQRQLLRDVSHELRSPLARLRIALALAGRASPEEREKLWPRLDRECDRLEALISEILTLARLDADMAKTEPVDLQTLLQRVSNDALLDGLPPPIDLQVQAPLSVEGWPDMIERAVDNLLRNARRFSPADRAVELHASRRDGRIRISVRDHGPGAASEHLAQLGEPFFRAPGQASAGHGLGLAIARRAAERHGGSLTLTNHPEGGFLAVLELPPEPITASL